ncbi:MAG: metallophosphoesterase family protein [Anaerolineae bacterium]
MARILHFADLHLDTSFKHIASSGRVDQRPRQGLRDCLRRIVDMALQHQVDVVTIGGDLYEQKRRCADTGNFIRDQLHRLESTPVVIAPGNHDPYTPDSLYRAVDWPSNVKVLSGASLEGIDVGGDLTIWGAAFTNRYRRDCPLDDFAGLGVNGRRNLLLLHAAVGDPPSDYSPLAAGAARRAGFDLALLGHIHDGAYSRPDDGLYYPGSPEPLDFSEAGERHVLLVDTDGEAPLVRRLPSNLMRFGNLAVDVSGAGSREAIRDLVLSQAEAAGVGGGTVRVRLVGTLDGAVDMDATALREGLAAHFAFVDLADETQPPYDFEGEAQGFTTKARFVQRLRAAMANAAADEDREICEEALVLGLRAFERKGLFPFQRQAPPDGRLAGDGGQQ